MSQCERYDCEQPVTDEIIIEAGIAGVGQEIRTGRRLCRIGHVQERAIGD